CNNRWLSIAQQCSALLPDPGAQDTRLWLKPSCWMRRGPCIVGVRGWFGTLVLSRRPKMGNVRSLLGVVGFLATLFPLCAQWLNYPTPGIPRTPDGRVRLAAPAPKAPYGKPDLSGIWQVSEQQSTYGPWTSHFMDFAVDLKPEEAP